MSDISLGKLERVDLRDIWTTEDQDFTPWVAKEGNLQILGETIGIDLELEAQEKNVGPFRADILCKDIASDTWVLIENQLERTDHTHLGQLLTYATGLDAVTIVWIAARFINEHRATMDWLNSITDERFRFFGLEIELWRIGESSVAPKFNIVTSPNEWSKAVSSGVRRINEGDQSELKALQLEYWTLLQEKVQQRNGILTARVRARPRGHMTFPIGRTGFRLSAAMIRRDKKIRSELYLRGSNAKAFFYLLRDQKNEIEKELGYTLEWEELPTKTDSRIAVYFDDADPKDKSSWDLQHNWLIDRLEDLHNVLSQRIRSLDVDDWQPEDDEAEEASD